MATVPARQRCGPGSRVGTRLDADAGHIYNVGSSEENYRLRELGTLIVELTPGTRLVVDSSMPDRRTYHVRFDRFARAAGFRPSRSLRDGLLELRDFLTASPEVDVDDPRANNARWLAAHLPAG